METNKAPNFRRKFEIWHEKTFGYVVEPKKGFTAFNCEYPHTKQQARWEGWQANNENFYDEGFKAGVKSVVKGRVMESRKQLGIDKPHIYKRDGFWYVSAPRSKDDKNWQTAYLFTRIRNPGSFAYTCKQL